MPTLRSHHKKKGKREYGKIRKRFGVNQLLDLG